MKHVVLVIGRAQGTWEEVAEANRLVGSVCGPFDEVVAVNDAGYDYPRVDHWVSFHGDKFEQWTLKRRANGYEPAKLWTSTYGRKESTYERLLGRQGVQRINYTGGGSSGLVAVLVALIRLHATHIICAGVPLDIERGHYNQDGPWKEALKHRAAWTAIYKHLVPFVRSMSGWTAQTLGKPDADWLRLELVSRTTEIDLR
jgi:hypothetical protein